MVRLTVRMVERDFENWMIVVGVGVVSITIMNRMWFESHSDIATHLLMPSNLRDLPPDKAIVLTKLIGFTRAQRALLPSFPSASSSALDILNGALGTDRLIN